MKSSHLISLFLLICIVSCSGPKEKDYSYPVEKYLELGIPDINRPWKISEFANVVATLRDIQNNEPLSLPRKDSKKSGQIFEQMISMENLSFLNIDTLPLYEKAYRIQSFLHIQSEYVDIYTDMYKREQYYSKELIECYLFGLRVTQNMINLGRKINESDKPGNVALQSGFSGVQYLHVTMLADALDRQKNTSLYNTEDLERLSDSISVSIRRNISWFDSTHVEMIKPNMRVVIDSTTSDKIRNEYSDIMNRL